MKNTAKRIKKYKELKADIVDIDIRLEETEDNCIIRTLEKERAEKDREVRRIENALNFLDSPHRIVVEGILIENKRYIDLMNELHVSDSRINQIKREGLNQLSRYIP